jgi:hypothetical protein
LFGAASNTGDFTSFTGVSNTGDSTGFAPGTLKLIGLFGTASNTGEFTIPAGLAPGLNGEYEGFAVVGVESGNVDVRSNEVFNDGDRTVGASGTFKLMGLFGADSNTGDFTVVFIWFET